MRPESLNHYRIVQTLGAGGMGEVYLAEDTKLHRKVAIKVLLDEAAANPERRERFAREARAVAAITHPNIVTIHSVEEDAGRLFLTMEYVEGKPLGELIPRGGLPLDKLLGIAIPLADAVASAHQNGIVHRDLKPANVMLSQDGRVKVLDFGLARLREDALGVGETMTAQITGEGRVLGTAAYMAPEQAEARPVDARSDLFSLGVVLYEMATGERPFKGDSTASLISSILRDTPQSVTALRRDVPRELARIIKRCLQKDPEQRYQTAKDLRNDLQLLKTEIESGEISATDLAPPAHSARRRHTPLALAAVGVLLAAAAVTGYLAWSRRAEPRLPFERFTARKITNQGNVTTTPAISPDGTYIAYAAREESGQSMRLKQLSTGAESVVVPPRGDNFKSLMFSPDGQYLYYLVTETSLAKARGTFYRVSFLGGPSTKLIDDVSLIGLAPDGKRVAFVRPDPARGEEKLIVSSVDGSNQKVITTLRSDHGFSLSPPSWSPDGTRIAVCVWKQWATVVVYSADAGAERVLAGATKWGAITQVQWTPDGSGLYVTAAHQSTGWFLQIWHVSFPDGDIRRLTNDANNYAGASLPRDGSSIVTLQTEWLSRLWVAPAASPDRVSAVGVGLGDGCGGVAWTPDGRIVYGTREWDIATIDGDGRNQRILTVDEHNNRHPAVSRDGRYIFFMSWRGNSAGAQYRMNIDGGDVRRLTTVEGEFPQVTPDGRWLLFSADTGGRSATWRVNADGGTEELFSKEITGSCAMSPDGTLVAGMRRDSSTRRFALSIVSFPTAAVVKTLDVPQELDVQSRQGWDTVHWTPDGNAVVYVGRTGPVANLWVQPIAGSPARPLTNFTSELIWGFDWSRDNRLVIARGENKQDVLMISREQ